MSNVRKFLFFDPTTGQYREQTASDTIQIADGVNAADAVNKSQLDAVASAATSAIAAEETRALAAESALQTAIDGVAADLVTETSRATAAEGAIAADLAAEITNRESAITSLNTSLSADILAEQTRAQAAEAGLGQDILDEQSRAEGVESGLQSQITQEISDREAAITSLNSTLSAAITAEETRALAAEGVLQGNIDAEESARIAADSALQTALDGEIARATAAEGVLTTNLAAEVSDREAAVSAEALARQTADEGLAADISAEEVRALAAEGVLDAKIDTEISDRIAAVSAEESARIAGDASTLAEAKLYADSLVEGISFKTSVRVALPWSFEFDGNTVTLPADFSTIAGPAGLAAGDRVLLINSESEGAGVDEGIYVVNEAGTALVRAADMKVGSDASGAYVYVEEGVLGSTIPHAVPGTSFVCANVKGGDVVGTDPLDWAIFQRVENLNFMDGLSKEGLDVKVMAKADGAIGVSMEGVELLYSSTYLKVEGGSLTLAEPLVGGKTVLADDLHGHSRMTTMRASTSASAAHFCKYDGSGASWSSGSCLGLVEEKDGSNNALIVLGGLGAHSSLASSLSAFSVGDMVYLGENPGEFSDFSGVPSGKWAIPVGKKSATGGMNVCIGTALLKA